CECAAHAGQAARAAATSADASPISPDQISSPVAGSVEMSVSATAARSTTGSFASSCCRILTHRIAHPADGINLIVERLPVVARRDRIPDRLDLVDVHRAGRGIGPIWVRRRPFASFERPGKRAERVGRIKLRARIAAAAPVEEYAVDGLGARA